MSARDAPNLQGVGQNTIEDLLVSSVQPNASTAILASPPPRPLAAAAMDAAQQTTIRLVSKKTAASTADTGRSVIGNRPTLKSNMMWSEPNAEVGTSTAVG